MELELQKNELICYETIGGGCIQGEETLETAIPEYCPDMARLVDAVGQLYIKEKVAAQNRMTVRGEVKVTVLYTSEETAGLRTLSMTVPFTCISEDSRWEGCEKLWAYGRVLLVDARAVTSRKLYLKVIPEVCVMGYFKRTCQICEEIPSEQSLQVKKEKLQVNLLENVSENEFSFMQDVMPAQEIIPEDLLAYRLSATVDSIQRVGKKAMLKGSLELEALFRGSEQGLHTYNTVMPFSQILDEAELPEDTECAAQVQLCEGEARLLRTDAGCGFSVSARLRIFLCAYGKKEIFYIADLYSTEDETEVEQKMVRIPEEQIGKVMTKEMNQYLEFGQKVPFLYVLSMDCGQISQRQSEGKIQLAAVCRAKILYLDENGVPLSTEKSEEIVMETEEISGGFCACCHEAKITFSGDACQLRIPLSINMRNTVTLELNTVGNVITQEREKTGGPSLILRRMQSTETLWDIAKQYRTKESLIREVNHMEEDSMPETMLLIPKVR